MVFNLSDHNSIASRYLLELRHPEIQRDRMRFRRNLERLGEIMAYEISKTMVYEETELRTTLGLAKVRDIQSQPVLVSVLRAGLPLLEGFLNVFDQAQAGLIGAYRDESGETLAIRMEYLAIPETSGQMVIVMDPMLATGGSLISSLEAMLEKSTPSELHIACVIAAPEGIRRLTEFLEPKKLRYRLWIGVIDHHLNDNYYIIPGLGDAGDLSFGKKID